ncbi:MAG TPA: 4-(cytidine 5'-diphospho)-2-C-methyl-D-erythritol kinase [Burkholderiaceae bacterium]|nr:4-(cytidine 5'-diphospho)-2-C-methyl-D-erythritol kinase [Burkholderiaceae bacterium]
MALYDVPAPAKLNLFLHVVGRRADGYHLLQTVFRFIDLNDSLDFDARGDGRISCHNPGLTDPSDDLIVRAARALQQAAAIKTGAHIVCRKTIPMGGGLGGGSSDAATTLIALNRLWGAGLSRAELMRLGLSLGADVPVFVFGQSAFAQGVGEKLAAVELRERAYIVAQPFRNVPTQAIFQSPELTRNTACVKIAVFSNWQKSSGTDGVGGRGGNGGTDSGGDGTLGKGYGQGLALFGRNDLEPVACAMYPEVGRLAGRFRECGVVARMTGSGGCFFAEFVNMDQARTCLREVTDTIPSHSEGGEAPVIKRSWLCQGLTEHPLRHWISS